jgi:serine protease
MKTRATLLLNVLTVCAWTLPLLAADQLYRTDQIVVKPRATATQIATKHRALGTKVLRTFPRFHNLQLIELPQGISVEAAIDHYTRSGLVEYAEPNHLIISASQKMPNDSSFGSLWNMHNTTQDADIDAPESWYFRTDASSVIVAVIDTGVNYNHDDLKANMWVNWAENPNNSLDDDGNGYTNDVYGINTTQGEDPADPFDDTQGHGTHVAGSVGAAGNNNLGVVGVA